MWREGILKIRKYISSDCEQLTELFYQTVHAVNAKVYQRQGVASAICDELEQAVNVDTIVTHASITAKPFFEQRRYNVIKEQQVVRKGIALTNYVMEK